MNKTLEAANRRIAKFLEGEKIEDDETAICAFVRIDEDETIEYSSLEELNFLLCRLFVSGRFADIKMPGDMRFSKFKGFSSSVEWLVLSKAIKSLYGYECMKCGKKKGVFHSDHIVPKSVNPELALEPSNIQVLCAKCNVKKLNYNSIDYRTDEHRKRFAENFEDIHEATMERHLELSTPIMDYQWAEDFTEAKHNRRKLCMYANIPPKFIEKLKAECDIEIFRIFTHPVKKTCVIPMIYVPECNGVIDIDLHENGAGVGYKIYREFGLKSVELTIKQAMGLPVGIILDRIDTPWV